MICAWLLRHGVVITRVMNGRLIALNVYAEPLRWYFGVAFWRVQRVRPARRETA